MDSDFANKMNRSLQNMRAKVVAAKGKSVKGLSAVAPSKKKTANKNDRGNKEWKN